MSSGDFGSWSEVVAHIEALVAEARQSPEFQRHLTLADVLTGNELAQQPFASDTVLNGPVMCDPLGECFARMGREEQRVYVKRAIAYATLGDAPLEYTLAALLAWSYAPVPRSS